MQLISLVRGFLPDPKIVLLDEVFSSLDRDKKKMVLKYLSDFILNQETLVIFTSHEDIHSEITFEELNLS